MSYSNPTKKARAWAAKHKAFCDQMDALVVLAETNPIEAFYRGVYEILDYLGDPTARLCMEQILEIGGRKVEGAHEETITGGIEVTQ